MFHYGLIEGFYGRRWSWAERADMTRFLAGHGYRRYVYAPKGDAALRRDWRQPFADEWLQTVEQWARVCRTEGIEWGLGLSPTGLQGRYGKAERQLLRDRLRELDALAPDCLWILFDDMRGDLPRLAINQCAVLDHVLAETAAAVAVCPTYYSFDPVLTQVFGPMPKGYLEELGHALPDAVDILWTGESVLSARYTEADCGRVADLLRRPPLIWDNYPVNDGRKTSDHLHLDAFRGRPWQLRDWTRGQMVNPMNQPALSQLPLSTLPAVYRQRDDYDPDAARRAAFARLPEELAALLERDWRCFQFDGRSSLPGKERESILAEYERMPHPAAEEVCRWLRGEYEFDPACLTE